MSELVAVDLVADDLAGDFDSGSDLEWIRRYSDLADKESGRMAKMGIS